MLARPEAAQQRPLIEPPEDLGRAESDVGPQNPLASSDVVGALYVASVKQRVLPTQQISVWTMKTDRRSLAASFNIFLHRSSPGENHNDFRVTLRDHEVLEQQQIYRRNINREK